MLVAPAPAGAGHLCAFEWRTSARPSGDDCAVCGKRWSRGCKLRRCFECRRAVCTGCRRTAA
eukprot:246970-Alexandrium_andersonii.AAC.1